MNVLSSIIKFKDLRSKIIFVLISLAIFRLGSHIPIAGIDLTKLNQLFAQGGLLGFFNLFSGGGLSRFSIFALGILPYINASIIMQLMSFASPKMKELSESGDGGRKQISQYTRYLAVFIAVIQSLGMAIGFRQFVLPNFDPLFFILYAVISLVAGAALVMWIGELISEYGIGNGASLLIFFGIISEMPSYIRNTYVLISGGANPFGVFLLIFVMMLMIISIVFVQEAQRRVIVQYAKRVVGRKLLGGQNTYIPLKLIQGGVMPIIFASAILQFPLMFFQYAPIQGIQNFLSTYYRYDGLIYNGLFCFLIFFFTYFYTAITFNPQDLAENIKKQGGFINGVRPGKSTVVYLEKIISKLTLLGASFLALVAIVPIVTANLTDITSFMGLGGTALLIIVGVAMDLVKQIETYVLHRKYEGLL